MKLIRKSRLNIVIIVISTNNPSRFKVKDFRKRNDLFHQLKIFTRWRACRDAIYILNNVSVSRETSDFQARKLVIMMMTKKEKEEKEGRFDVAWETISYFDLSSVSLLSFSFQSFDNSCECDIFVTNASKFRASKRP